MKSMKKIEFQTIGHLVMFLGSALMAVISFIGMFMNPVYVVFFAMSVLLCVAVYKERNW